MGQNQVLVALVKRILPVDGRFLKQSCLLTRESDAIIGGNKGSSKHTDATLEYILMPAHFW